MQTFRKNWQLFAVVAGFALVFVLIYGLRQALFPFLLGFVVVHLAKPAVSWVERRFPRKGRWLAGKRVLSIAAVSAAALFVLGLFSFFLFNAIISAFSVLLQNATDHWLRAVAVLQGWTESARQLVPDAVRGQIDTFVTEVGLTITQSVREDFTQQVAQIPRSFGAVLGIAVLPFFVFFMLKDREKLSRAFYAGLPSWAAGHVGSIFGIMEDVLGRYIRATLALGAVVGLMTLAGLLIIDAPMAPFLAVVAGVGEMIPTLGPWLGGVIAIVVTLALAPEKAVFVLALAFGVQVLENNLLVPRIQSGFLGLHPVVTIVLLVVGAASAGVWGILLAVPLTATAVQIARYVRRELRKESEAPKAAPDATT